MFETTESADQEHVDERAYKFFSYMYGRNGHHKGWDSTKEGLRPTATLGKSDRMRACAYCGAGRSLSRRSSTATAPGRMNTKTLVTAVCVKKRWMNLTWLTKSISLPNSSMQRFPNASRLCQRPTRQSYWP